MAGGGPRRGTCNAGQFVRGDHGVGFWFVIGCCGYAAAGVHAFLQQPFIHRLNKSALPKQVSNRVHIVRSVVCTHLAVLLYKFRVELDNNAQQPSRFTPPYCRCYSQKIDLSPSPKINDSSTSPSLKHHCLQHPLEIFVFIPYYLFCI